MLGQISLVSWNVLAPSYAKPEKYPWVTADDLSWDRRQARILDRLAEYDPDIVCLQEVEVALWDDLQSGFSALGYDGVLQEMKNDHPVACAVLLRRGVIELERAESRSRALITVLRAGSAPTPLYLASVHLEAGREKGATRLNQLRSLMRRLELQRGKDTNRKMHTRSRIANCRPNVSRRVLRKSSHAHRATHGLRDRFETLEIAVGTVSAEALDRGVDQPRIDLLQHIISKAHAVQRTR